MKVALVSPHTRSQTQRFPLGLMIISSYLTSKNVDNEIIDVKSISLTPEETFQQTVSRIISCNPNIVGIGCCATEIFEVKRICVQIREKLPSCIIVLGGPHPTYKPEDFVESDTPFDYIVIGEGEITLFELASAIKDGSDIDKGKGILYKKNGELVRTEPQALIENLDELPLPAYEKIDMDYYTQPNVWSIRPVLLSSVWLFTSRACPYSCKYCVAHVVFGRKVRKRSPENVVAEIEYLVNKYNIDGFFIADEIFTVEKKRTQRICELLKEKKLNVLWGCQTRANLIDDQSVKSMKESGCIQIDFGIESGSDRVLQTMGKQIKVEQYKKAAKICRKYGMRQLANMMINIPGERLEDIDLSVKLAKESKYNVLFWNAYTPIPGVSFGSELSLHDLESQLNFSSVSSYEMLEKKYKFGDYGKPIIEVLKDLYAIFPHPRYVRISLNPFYYIRWLRYFSFVFNAKYLKKILTSKRRWQYFKVLTHFYDQTKVR